MAKEKDPQNSEVDQKEIKRCMQLVDKIVKAQGNIFIKELLRSKKKTHPDIRIGVKKDEIVSNLQTAISKGFITYEDLLSWINEVEGWGRQHVYLFSLDEEFRNDPAWESPGNLRQKVADIKFGDAWNREVGLVFPKTLKLSRIYFDGNKFECVWHQGVFRLKREELMDPPDRVIEGDLYKFHAYRHTPLRSVMRFELYLDTLLAGLFIQVPLGKDHKKAYQQALQILGRIFKFQQLMPVNISRAIVSLDQLELDAGGEKQSILEAYNTKFEAKGATVEFAGSTGIGGFKNVTEIRDVRKALDEKSFHGDSAKFIIHIQSGEEKGGEMKRDVIMSMNGGQKRIFLHAQMTLSEVWYILGFVRSHAE